MTKLFLSSYDLYFAFCFLILFSWLSEREIGAKGPKHENKNVKSQDKGCSRNE